MHPWDAGPWFGVDPRGPVGAVTVGVDLPDLGGRGGLIGLACGAGLCGGLVPVAAGAKDAQDPAYPLHIEHGAVLSAGRGGRMMARGAPHHPVGLAVRGGGRWLCGRCLP